MNYFRCIIVACFSILFFGCGDSYPTEGIFSGGKGANIFSLTSTELSQWQKDNKLINDLSAATEDELLALAEKLSQSMSVAPYLNGKSLLAEPDIDILVKKKQLVINNNIEIILKSIDNVVSSLTILEQTKASSEAAKNKLELLLEPVRKEEKNIPIEHKNLSSEFPKFFQPYTSKDIGVTFNEETQKYNKKLFSHNSFSQKEPLCSGAHLLFSDPIKMDNGYFCAFFSPFPTSSRANKKIALITSLNSSEKAILKKVAELTFKQGNLKRYIKSRINEIENNNMSLVKMTKSFTYREEKKLNKLKKILKKLNMNLETAKAITPQKIRTDIFNTLKKEIAQVRPHYIHEQLINSLTKVANVEVDGSFQLPEKNNFYLVESTGKFLHENKYALLRMSHFKNLDLAKVEKNDLFSFNELNKLSL